MPAPGFFVAAAACFAVQAALALLVIPPWQNPDEPQHVMAVRQVLSYGPTYRHDLLDRRAEQAILASMAEHGWWSHYGRVTPRPLPQSFADGPALVIGGYFGPPDGGSRMYYRLIATLFRLARIDTVVAQLYAMRAVSALLALLTLTCVWWGVRAALDSLAAAVVTAVMSLHPQFILVSTSATPDAAVNLAGALVFCAALVILAGERARPGHLAVLWGAAMGAFLLRRVGAPLVAIAAGVTLFVLFRSNAHHRGWSHALRGSATAVVLLALAVAAGEGTRALEWILRNPISVDALATAEWFELPRFLNALHRSFWLSAGWLRYLPPGWWVATAIGLTTVAAIGVIKGPSSPVPRRVVVAAAAMLTVQTVAVIALYFVVLRTGASGRYLFTVLPAALLLLWVGWRAWFGPAGEPMAARALIMTAAVLNASGWATVILPAYV